MTITTRATLGLVAAFAIAFCSSAASAAMIEIQFTGLDIVYDGSSITDAGGAGADTLSTTTIQVDGVDAPGTPFASGGLAIDIDIPGVSAIPLTTGSVTTVGAGSATLTLPGGDFLSLVLGPATITYVDGGFAEFVFGGSVASISGQSLPLPGDLELGEPTSFSFSTQIGASTDDGTNFTSFSASGTGEITGPAIPEPTAAVLAALAGIAAIGRRSA
ncbi:MAG: hypothetical protein AAF805_11045 [Planctomycetota bacterium]